ncbi:hypothetical protein JCM8097_000512 [Rhodosporidiobolus ruineniae]
MPHGLSVASYAAQLSTALSHQDGPALAALVALAPLLRDKHQLELLDYLASDRWNGYGDREGRSNPPGYQALLHKHINKGFNKAGPWGDIATAHVGVLVALNPSANQATGLPMSQVDYVKAYEKQHEVVTALYRYLIDARDSSTGWALPTLYQVCRDLRKVAEQADQQLLASGQKAGKLEEASRLLQKCFSACLNDRASDMLASRKMGTYYLATLLFKVYFRLNSTALCRNLIRGIGAADLPPLSAFPRAHQVTYTYYMGVFAFLREDYGEAERKFQEALEGCHRKMKDNITLILDYLIPLLLLRGVRPSPSIYARSARHRTLYAPFADAIKSGNVAAYDRQLERAEKSLMKRGTYLVVERAREAAVRGCLKKAWILESKPARLSIETLRRYYNAAQRIGLEGGGGGAGDGSVGEAAGFEVDAEEMECLVAGLIYKGLVKGYISHAHGLVVLSKEKPFPWYPPYRPLSPTAAAARAQREKERREAAVVLPPLPDPPAAEGGGEVEMGES